MPKAKPKSVSSRIHALFKKPLTQYATVFLASYLAFLLLSLVTSQISLYQILPQLKNSFSTSPTWISYNLLVLVIETLLPAALFGAGFWLTGRALIALGAQRIGQATLWLDALVPATLFMILVLSSSLLSILGYMNFSPNAQVIFDVVTIPLLGLMYMAGWWMVRSRH